MSELIKAIYENGVLHPLQPLDLPENKIVKIDVRDVSETDTNYEDLIENELSTLEMD
jgi:predicted DNA-binding antitoxin AbrB/MazE fold protein